MIGASDQPLSEEETCALENRIPEWAAIATRTAYAKALASGLSVLVKRDGQFIEVHGDGTTNIVGQALPACRVRTGEVFKIDRHAKRR